MGYFEAVTSSYFKTDADGRKLFFPWGVLGRGYVIGTEQDQQRLMQKLKVYMIAAVVLIVGVGAVYGNYGVLAAGVALVVFYFFWAQSLVRGLQQSGEGMSVKESYTSQALAFSPATLWLMEILSLVLFIGAIAMFIFEPDSRGQAAGGIAIFGLLVAGGAWMLVLRRRASRQQSQH